MAKPKFLLSRPKFMTKPDYRSMHGAHSGSSEILLQGGKMGCKSPTEFMGKTERCMPSRACAGIEACHDQQRCLYILVWPPTTVC